MNYALGLLRATKPVADGGPVTVSASYNAITGTRIAGNVQPELRESAAQTERLGLSLVQGCKVLAGPWGPSAV